MRDKFVSVLLIGLALQLLCSENISAQTAGPSLSLSLKNVVDLAITQSTSIKYVQNRNVRSYWRYKNFQTGFRPQLILTGDMPNFSHSTEPITQPDGSVEFKTVSNARMYANLALNQSIAATGTRLYAATSIYRIEDFNNNNVEFSGTPISVGFVQPIFSYNWMKWEKRTEPLIYEESLRNFIESVEQISLSATYRATPGCALSPLAYFSRPAQWPCQDLQSLLHFLYLPVYFFRDNPHVKARLS